MSDAFISYSRIDADFVHRLSEALLARELSVWVDWEGIAPTAEWLAEIQRAIEAADHFLFVISPDSVASEICALELNHAVEHNKRLVPILFRQVDIRDLPPALARHQWFSLDEEQSFDTLMDRLVETIRADPQAVHEHTRLLGRALEWRDGGKEHSKLLRGRALADAEAWIAGAPRDPEPTGLQQGFIGASRQAAVRARRFGAGLALLLLMGAGVGAGYYFKARQEAQLQGLAALSRATASQALAEQDQAYDLALLLAVEAHAISPTLEAEGALQRLLLARPRLERILRGPDAVAVGMRFGPDGKRLAVGYGDGAARLWTLDGSTEPVRIDPDIKASVATFAFNRSLDRAALGSGQRDAIALRRLPDGETVGALPTGRELEVLQLVFSPDDLVLASANGMRGSGITLWRMGQTTQRGDALIAEPGFSAVAFSPDGRRVASGGWSEEVWIWDATSGRLLHTHALAGASGLAALALTGTQLIAATDSIQLFDLTRPDAPPMRVLKGPLDSTRSVAVDSEGHWLAAGYGDGVVAVWDLARGDNAPEVLGGSGSYVDTLALSSAAHRLATGGYAQPVRVYALDTVSRFGRLLGRQAHSVASVAFSPDGRQVAAAGAARVVDVWSLDSGDGVTLNGHVSDIRALMFSPDGSRLWSADGRVLPTAQGRVDVLAWDLRAAPPALLSEPPAPLALGGLWGMFPDLPALRQTPWPVTIDEAATTLARPAPYRGGVAGIEVVSIPDGRVLTTLEAGFQHDLLSLALSADGKRLAAAGADGRYAVWDVDSGRKLLAGQGGDRGVCGVMTLSRDGARLAVACRNALIVHDVDAGADPIGRFAGPFIAHGALAFDPTGKRLAASGANGGWVLWDVDLGRAVGGSFAAPGAVAALGFSRDGKSLVSGDRDGRVLVWDVSVERWKARACRVTGRELSAEEWRRYLPERQPVARCAMLALSK